LPALSKQKIGYFDWQSKNATEQAFRANIKMETQTQIQIEKS